MLTTVCGLTIALPCLAAYPLLQSVAGRAALQMQWVASQLDEWLSGANVSREETGDPEATSSQRSAV